MSSTCCRRSWPSTPRLRSFGQDATCTSRTPKCSSVPFQATRAGPRSTFREVSGCAASADSGPWRTKGRELSQAHAGLCGDGLDIVGRELRPQATTLCRIPRGDERASSLCLLVRRLPFGPSARGSLRGSLVSFGGIRQLPELGISVADETVERR